MIKIPFITYIIEKISEHDYFGVIKGLPRVFAASLHRNEWDFTSQKDEQFDKTKYKVISYLIISL